MAMAHALGAARVRPKNYPRPVTQGCYTSRCQSKSGWPGVATEKSMAHLRPLARLALFLRPSFVYGVVCGAALALAGYPLSGIATPMHRAASTP